MQASFYKSSLHRFCPSCSEQIAGHCADAMLQGRLAKEERKKRNHRLVLQTQQAREEQNRQMATRMGQEGKGQQQAGEKEEQKKSLWLQN